MPGILIISERRDASQLAGALTAKGFFCSVASSLDAVLEQIDKKMPDIVLAEMSGGALTNEQCCRLKSDRLHIIAVVERNGLKALDLNVLSDFVVEPVDITELVMRINRILRRTGSEVIVCGDLVIDLAKCEVSIEGRQIMLTFKEYELLKFLATNKDRVFTRDALLNEVWGYDYYGGDRTVDVHIRRLRSKIEDSRHFFIDTVRNIGYRFKNGTHSDAQ